MQNQPELMPDPPDARAWYVRAFSDEYLYLYAHRTEAEAAAQVEVARKVLPFSPGQRVLDIACGAGRHLIAFAKQGALVTGVDLSADLLQRAKQRCVELGLKAVLKQADMRELPFENKFNGVTMWFTSFGYFSHVDDDLRVLRGVHRALKQDGWWWIDLPNPVYLKRNLIPASERSLAGPYGMATVREERKIDGSHVIKTVQIRDTRGERSYEERVRLYTAECFAALVKQAGLVAEGLLGDYDGKPFSPEHPRQIWFGRKPGRDAAQCAGT